MKFSDRVRRTRTLFLVECAIVSRKVVIRPSIRVGTVEAERVAIVSVDVDGSQPSTWCEVSMRVGVIAQEWDYNASVSNLLFDIGEVLMITTYTG